MSLSSTTMAAAVGPWLGRLPLEVRELIYQQVLVEKIEHRMKSAEYDQYRDEILAGLDHTWRYNTAILRTNSTLYREAMTVFKRDNFLVCLQLRQWNVAGCELRSCGFQPFATYDKAEDVPAGVAMTLTFGPHPAAPEHVGAEEWESQNYVFDSEDLHAVCTNLLRAGARTSGGFGGGFLGITIDAAMGVGLREMRDGFPHPQSRLRGLLEPLRRLHSFDEVSVDGPGSVVYKDEIVASLMRGADAKETMRLALLATSRGDEACGAGELGLAIDRYKAGLELSRGNFPDVVAADDDLDGDSEEGGVAQSAIDDTNVRLQTRLAAAYLQSGKTRMARIYAERVYGPHHDYDIRHNKQKFPLQIDADRGPLFAKVLVVAAQISYTHGKVDEALEELRNAVALDEECEEARDLQSRYLERQGLLKKREAVRREARDRQGRVQMVVEEDVGFEVCSEEVMAWDPSSEEIAAWDSSSSSMW